MSSQTSIQRCFQMVSVANIWQHILQHMATTSHEEPKKSPTAEDIEPDFSEFQDLHFNLFEKIAEYWNSDTLHQAEPWNPERHSCQNR